MIEINLDPRAQRIMANAPNSETVSEREVCSLGLSLPKQLILITHGGEFALPQSGPGVVRCTEHRTLISTTMTRGRAV